MTKATTATVKAILLILVASLLLSSLILTAISILTVSQTWLNCAGLLNLLEILGRESIIA